MNIPALARSRPLIFVLRFSSSLLLALLPLALAFAFALHFAFQQRFGGPVPGFGFLLRGEAPLVLEIDFRGGAVGVGAVGGWLWRGRGGVGGEEARGPGGGGGVRGRC